MADLAMRVCLLVFPWGRFVLIIYCICSDEEFAIATSKVRSRCASMKCRSIEYQTIIKLMLHSFL